MPPRNDELPEGTDHIINGAMETGGGGGDSGFVGSGAGNDTGGTAAAEGGIMTATSDRSGAGSAALDTEGRSRAGGGGSAGGASGGGGVTDQLRSQVSSLRDQAGGRVREFADGGKTRASEMLEELSRVVADTADSIDERLGNNYGEYARKASDSVSGLAETLRTRDVDELYDNVRDAVRKSPGVAIGIAAVVGFTLVRLVKAGLDQDEGTRGGRNDEVGGPGARGATGGPTGGLGD